MEERTKKKETHEIQTKRSQPTLLSDLNYKHPLRLSVRSNRTHNDDGFNLILRQTMNA